MSERTPKSSSLKGEEVCQSNSCNNRLVTKCKYCKRVFCKEHIEPLVVSSPQGIWNLNQIRNSDPEKYEKYMKDWNRTDGHPCPEYTVRWNEEHEKNTNKPPIKLPPIRVPSSSPPPPPNRSRNRSRLAIVIILVVLVLVFAFSIFVLNI